MQNYNNNKYNIKHEREVIKWKKAKLNVIVIGGVACGPKTAARIKRLNPDANVIIIEKGELLSYAGCGLPFFISVI